MYAVLVEVALIIKKDDKRSNDKVNSIISDEKSYDNGIPVEMYFLLLLILVILGLILGVF